MTANSQVSFAAFAGTLPFLPTFKTAEQVQREFREAGISVAEWARVHGFDRNAVVDVLRGHRQGNFGEAHRVAVALGLKVGHVVDVGTVVFLGMRRRT